MNIICIGAGVMSSAFAIAQSAQHKVTIIPSEFDKSLVSDIQSKLYDDRLKVEWPSIEFKTLSEITECDIVVIGVSSQGLGWAIEQALDLNKRYNPIFLSLTKGLHVVNGRIVSLTQTMEKKLGVIVHSITGPCIAKNLAHGQDTYVVFSSSQYDVSKDLAGYLSTPFYRIEVSDDEVGCQWSAALKNIYAIAVGYGGENDNYKASQFTAALTEMSQWVTEYGGRDETVRGLSGLGDLYVTCQGGRNGKLGQFLAKGLSISDILTGPMKGVTVEGYDLLMGLQNAVDASDKPLFCKLMDLVSD